MGKVLEAPQKASTPEEEKYNKEEYLKEHLETDITKMLHELGIPAHIKRLSVSADAITMVVKDREMMEAVTKILYPEIAKKKSHQLQSRRAGYPSCDRGCLGQRKPGSDR